MILIDANLLIYAHVRDFDQHERARSWLDAQFAGTGARVGLPWSSLLAFLRLVTSPRVFDRPESTAAAWQQVEEWLDRDGAWVPEAGKRYRHVLGSLLDRVAVSANLVPDAHLAALAIEHGLAVASTDGDFARFPDLRWINPIATI
jgi:toxin-antitoxin system PIN domain toxin